MRSSFKLSTVSLAVILACNPLAYATTAKHKHHHTNTAASTEQNTSQNTETNSYFEQLTTSYSPMVLSGIQSTSDAWKWSPIAPIMPTNYSQFLVWVEDINAGKSKEPLFACWRDMLCVSGLLDLDAYYFNRTGNPFGPTAATAGTGTRPVFGEKTGELLGSINNANVFVDLKFAELVRIHADIDYVNGGIKEDTYAWVPMGDIYSVYTNGASVKADELYAVFSNEMLNPLYLKIGKFYLDFGDYLPNGYGLPTIVPSLTQLMTQTRTGGAQLGFGLNNGLYGSATWSMAQESILDIGGKGIAARNYSAKLGMMRQYQKAYFNVSGSFIWDIRDTDYMNGMLYVLNNGWETSFGGSFFGPFTMKRQHAFAVHADGKYGQFGGGVEAAATTGHLNSSSENSNLWTAGADINYSFPVFGHASVIDLGYQIARHARIINGVGTLTDPPFTGFPIGPFANQFPAERYVGTYIVKIVKHVNTALQWVHDQDFGHTSGSNRASDYGVFRIDLEF